MKLLFLGDSHAQVFRFIAKEKLLGNCEIDVVDVPGATAQGIVNPESQTNALQTFRGYVKAHGAYDYIFIQLGEVDCGFVIWYRAKKYREPVRRQLENSLDHYFTFAAWLKENTSARVVLTGATPPTIKDGQDQAWRPDDPRKEVTTSLAGRTALTLEYNRRLQEHARESGLGYIEITQYVMDEHGLMEYYRHPDPLDHHLSESRTAPLWAKEIERIIHET